jgi:hypothetical protein
MMSPEAAGAMMVPGVTIGSGMDVVSGVMNMGQNMPRKMHSSQMIFPGLHSEARTAKMPWLPKDPVMLREPERPPVYFRDAQAAEYARNSQAFKVSALPLGSPLVGGVGFQYAGRIKEIKIPETKNMIMQTQNDGIIKALPTMKANPWGLMIKNRINFSESNIVDEDLRGNVISRDQIGGNVWNAPNVFTNDNRVTGIRTQFGTELSPTSIGSGRVPEYARATFGSVNIPQKISDYQNEVTGFGRVYAEQKSGMRSLPPQTGSGPITVPYNDNAGVWDGKIQMAQPEVTGLGQTYAMQGGRQEYRDYLSGNPAIASANPYRGIIQDRMVKQRSSQQQVRQVNPKTLSEVRNAAIKEQARLTAEEEYVKQVAVQEGLKEVDALGGKSFAKPAPLMTAIKEVVYRKGPTEIEKQIFSLQNKYDGLREEAIKEVEDVAPGSPLPLNMMSNAKGNFEDLPVVLKQRVIEEEIYRKQNEEMQNRYNIEQAKYQEDLKEQMRQAAAIRNAQMDAAKKAQAAAEQMLAASGSAEKTAQEVKAISQLKFITPPDEYLTGEIMDPYYDEFQQNQVDIVAQNQQLLDQEAQMQQSAQQQSPEGYNAIKKKARAAQNGSEYETQQITYPGVAPENIPRISGAVPSGGTYGAG